MLAAKAAFSRPFSNARPVRRNFEAVKLPVPECMQFIHKGRINEHFQEIRSVIFTGLFEQHLLYIKEK
ncbi:hypothetical protein DTX80_15850 [Bacilli bacterium]|uniref:Uncharacterized protein n=1 Tax=Oceanobacillus caeni TaxID=405946 RepID=A0ABR5MKI4_9BACI|nr:hypothetical protein WH51_12180 [Bacilli bacterium VT-13-104]KPH76312.1 hypothetical protein AFL42_06665 [Oceanobacillus caeni]PZD85820.1 hypothetical protein DEJ64_09355 [Bacilli bacterium]PZD87535.1 hypothetical protein DEJ60_08620 [Bacilli bacterium]PZD90863.1 hypothetical protein DEJ66_09145 [Bacilli bacterium]